MIVLKLKTTGNQRMWGGVMIDIIGLIIVVLIITMIIYFDNGEIDDWTWKTYIAGARDSRVNN